MLEQKNECLTILRYHSIYLGIVTVQSTVPEIVRLVNRSGRGDYA